NYSLKYGGLHNYQVYSIFSSSLFSLPSFILPAPCSLLPTPYSLLPTPCSLLPKTQNFLPQPIENCYIFFPQHS
ncbi:MAG: hypothetical protein F6J98_27875, partial [Moorea sp. SIO4G2]|nr:hypothetical protein [Moorena sp. SIO4G2]